MKKFSELLRVTEAAKYLGVHENTLRRWTRARKIKTHTHPITKWPYYDMDELDALLSEFNTIK